ncbi:MAG: 50S ribosomal protein L37e [Nanoarchaeota archaeon]|nr:50S ribosomal protein L37e [Nanoarchaeota archaeon]
MVKGTPTLGKRGRGHKLHVACKRCGHNSFHRKKKVCSSCGFGKTSKLRKYKWDWKKKQKK